MCPYRERKKNLEEIQDQIAICAKRNKRLKKNQSQNIKGKQKSK